MDLATFFNRLDSLCPDRLLDKSSFKSLSIPTVAKPLIDEIVTEFTWFIKKIANHNNYDLHSLTGDDLTQEGTIGFITAVWKYRPDSGLFVPYAARWIKTAIWRAIYNRGHTIRLPMNVIYGGDTDIRDRFRTSRLDNSVSHSPLDTWAMQNDITNALNSLPEIEAEMIKSQFGLCNYEPMSQSEIARQYNVSQQAVQWRVKQAKRKIAAQLDWGQTVL